MYNPKTIREELSQLVGIRQNNNPDFPQLPPSVVYEDTGEKMLITHPLVTIENIDATARNYGKYVFPTWAIGTTYAEGDRVLYSGVSYEALRSTVGDQPDASPDDWAVLSLLDQFIQDVFENAAEETVNQVFIEKKLNKQAKTVLQSTRSFNGVGNFTDYIINEGKLVGVEISLIHYNNILAIIERVGLQLTMSQDDLTLYLYHTSQLEPIATLSIDQTKSNSMEWHDAKLRLNYLSEDLDAGGKFYLMYDQDDLDGQAIKKNFNFDRLPCYTCNANDVAGYHAISQWFRVRAVEVSAANRNAANDLWLWDVTKTKASPDNNHGLNFEFTVRCDLTRFIVQQKDVFAHAVREVTTLKLLEAMANSTRQNNAQTKLDVLARLELQSGVAGGMNFRKNVENAIKACGFEMSDLDPVCMPCSKVAGIRHATAGI